MAALAHRTEGPTVFVRFLQGPQPLGDVGRFVLEAEQKAYRHLSEPASSLLTAVGDLAYRPLPFRTAFTRQVRYHLGGRLQPLPYPDED